MARTIESPGIEIREIDLSNISTLPIGTNVLLQGFAAQGPTDELINVTSKTELEQIFGEPTTPAERYFIQSAKEVLNSPGRLLVNRLPYGEGTGEGTSPTRSALLFPYVPVFQTTVAPSTSVLTNTDNLTVVSSTSAFTLTKSYSGDLNVVIVESLSSQGNNVRSVTGQFLAAALDPSSVVLFDSFGNTISQFVTAVTNYSTYSQFDLSSEFDVQTLNLTIQYYISSSEFSEPSANGNVFTVNELIDSNIKSMSATYVYPSIFDGQTGVSYTTGNINLVPGASAVQYLKGFVLGAPVLLPNLSASQVESLLDGSIFNDFNYNSAATKGLAQTNLADASTDNATLFNTYAKKAGLIIVNSNFTNIEANYAGYYIGVNDNYNIRDEEYDKFKYLYTRDGSGSYKTLNSLPTTVTLKTPLSGSITENAGSVSEVVEIGPAFSSSFAGASGTQFQHSLEFSLWKVYESEFETQGNNKVLRTYYNVAPFVGSFVKNFKETLNNPYGGTSQQSMFLEDVYPTVGAKPWLDIRINPVIKNNMTQDKFIRTVKSTADLFNDSVIAGSLTQESIGDVAVEVNEVLSLNNTKSIDGLFALGPYAPTQASNSKKIGNVAKKLERGLALAENIDLIPLELVLDGGLSTIFAAMKDPNLIDRGVFDDAINFVNAGGEQGQQDWLVIFNLLNNFCQQTRQDCMCIVDPLRHIFVQNENTKVIEQKTKNFSQHIFTPLRNLVNPCNSSYAAIYANWVRTYDTGSGSFFWAPFSGFQAAIIARMDALLQPWFAPAGLNNGIIRNITDIAIKPTQRERDLLYRVGLNPITSFPRDGFVVYGQKTLQAKPSAFDRINVRRLFLFLEKATRQIAKYFVFEPNTVFTRTRFVNVLTPIFELAKNNQGVYDYLIVCDERNNTPDVIDRNELVVDIYIKPVRTAEFILINFIATRTGANFEEIISGTGA